VESFAGWQGDFGCEISNFGFQYGESDFFMLAEAGCSISLGETWIIDPLRVEGGGEGGMKNGIRKCWKTQGFREKFFNRFSGRLAGHRSPGSQFARKMPRQIEFAPANIATEK
jgi:hypothetical protein